MSLKCPLTKETIETPVRGIYCSHIHCFDLRSYLTLMLSTKVPSWTCPICKTLAAELKFDEMISIIIKKS
jgi:E3 SUMO-protein ligase PIAS1